jgi:signal recognition particle receptor subunit beta
MSDMENNVKIIISGLDYAGKTSILTALEKKYDFHKEILELKPTIRIEYHQTTFLGNICYFWDMGGQEKFRELYQKRQEIYFEGSDLLLYVIDIQDKNRFDESLGYLDSILQFFISTNQDVPLIIAFHKYDPEKRGDDEVNNNIVELRDILLIKYPTFKILFQQTSIFDIISIVQLISYGLSIFDQQFFELSELLEEYLIKFECISLILFDKNGIIISEFYGDNITPDIYIDLLENIKEHLFLLKRMQEEKTEATIYSMETDIFSYLHKFEVGEETLYLSVLIEEKLKDRFMEIFADFMDDLIPILKSIIT